MKSLRTACLAAAALLPPLQARAGAPERLAGHVIFLAGDIGERSIYKPEAQAAAADYIEKAFQKAGDEPRRQKYLVPPPRPGAEKDIAAYNIAAVLPGEGKDPPVLVVGAHYDTADGTPGADDNASGVAALLELARSLRSRPGKVELHLVAFCTEEPPFFATRSMGSRQYARSLKDARRDVVGMIALEMMGFYTGEQGAQKYPPLLKYFYPARGDYIGLVSNLRSRGFMKEVAAGLRPPGGLNVVRAALPSIFYQIALSDHSSFWKHGYKAVMITDTAYMRNRNYHRSADTPGTLDYRRMADAVAGVENSVLRITR